MIESPIFWLFLNFLSILILAFFSMEEMACVSFNKVRLQFYVSQANVNALRLNDLLQNPSTLFGTTLIGVNVATFFGSECARRFHEAIGVSPDLAPISQIFLVIVFGELAPMFAARRYAENVALLGMPLLYLSAKLLAPILKFLGYISKLANRLFGGHESHPYELLTQDELQKIIEEQDEEYPFQQVNEEFNAITSNIFHLRGKTAKHVMMPLTKGKIFSSHFTIKEMRKLWPSSDNYVIVYHRVIENIIGIVFLKDILRADPNKKIHDFFSVPWFISLSTPLIQTLKQFRRSSENIAIVLNEKGKAVGYLSFDDILDEIFEKSASKRIAQQKNVIDITMSGDVPLEKINKELDLNLEGGKDETLSGWIIRRLEHHPEPGETLFIPPYEFIVKETSLLDIRLVQIRTPI